jgi:hypothetical protein
MRYMLGRCLTNTYLIVSPLSIGVSGMHRYMGRCFVVFSITHGYFSAKAGYLMIKARYWKI